MKSKFTAILMFFIIIAIIGASCILGLVLWEEISQNFIMQTADVTEEDELFKLNKYDDEEVDPIEENIEVPKIRNTSNPLTELESGNSYNNEEISYEDITVNKYFYKQLDNYSQIIYKAFESNKDNMKSGNYKINLGSSFTNVLSKENGQKELGNYYQSAIEAYIYDNPDVFYLNPAKMYFNIETTTKGTKKTYNTYIDSGEHPNYLIDEFNSKEEVENAIEKIEIVRNNIVRKKTGNVYADIRMIHNYLVDSIEYDTSINEDNIYNIYGALVNKKCVCEGYAKAMKYLLDSIGVESTLVIGKAINTQGNSENHAWNYVKIDSNWYAIDSTWDDPVVIGGGKAGNASKYRYFLKGENTMKADHTPLGRFTENGKIFKYPELSSSDY